MIVSMRHGFGSLLVLSAGSSLLIALNRCLEPFPVVDVNGQLREIAFSALDQALGMKSEVRNASLL